MMTATTKSGTIRTVKDRGFGFIRADDQSDAYFHVSALHQELEFGDQLVGRRVTFETLKSDRGMQAIDIRQDVSGRRH